MSKKVVSIKENNSEIYALYDAGNKQDAYRIMYLAFYDDGSVEGIELCEGNFDLSSTASNFMGLFKKGDLPEGARIYE